VRTIEEQTGWRCRFGPVYAEDISDYVAANFVKTKEMRRARFPLGARLEMAVMWACPMSLLAGIPVAIFSPRSLPGVLALIWGFTLSVYLFYNPIARILPNLVGLVRTLALGAVGVAGLLVWSWAAGHWGTGTLVAWCLAIVAVALVLGFDLEGTSPLQAGATVSYWASRWPGVLKLWALIGYELEMPFALQVDTARCRGCQRCVDVCPKGVFELYLIDGKKKSRAARTSDCEQCTACVKQCPERAILADPPIRLFDAVEVS
jgi:2-oxoglutarate ferredoxin oxidoreductase subunit delta